MGNLDSKLQYRKYLESEEWKTLRSFCLLRYGAKCKLCGFESVENDAHHIRYRRSWRETRLEDLIILCRACHTKLHDRFGHSTNGVNWRCVKQALLHNFKALNPARCFLCGTNDCVQKRDLMQNPKPPKHDWYQGWIGLCDGCWTTRFPRIPFTLHRKLARRWEQITAFRNQDVELTNLRKSRMDMSLPVSTASG